MPSTLRLLVCASGIYASFLSWALIQERLSTTPYYAEDGGDPRYFRHVVFLNTVQSSFSAMAALLYMLARSSKGHSWLEMLGLAEVKVPKQATRRVAEELILTHACRISR